MRTRQLCQVPIPGYPIRHLFMRLQVERIVLIQEERPIDIINRLAKERRSWSDEQILDELRLLPVLPDEDYYDSVRADDPQWLRAPQSIPRR